MFRRLVAAGASLALAAGLLVGLLAGLQSPAQAHGGHEHHGHHRHHGHGGYPGHPQGHHDHQDHQGHHPGKPGELYEQGINKEPYTYEDTECGFTIRTDGRVFERYKYYRAPGSTQAFLGHSWYRWHETLTNPATGKKMYASGRGYFREVKATRLYGDVYEFISLDSGAPYTLRDAKGRVVLADRGTIVLRSVQDTLGDGVPGSEELSFEVVKVLRGHFPSYDEDFDFCAIASRLIG